MDQTFSARFSYCWNFFACMILSDADSVLTVFLYFTEIYFCPQHPNTTNLKIDETYHSSDILMHISGQESVRSKARKIHLLTYHASDRMFDIRCSLSQDLRNLWWNLGLPDLVDSGFVNVLNLIGLR